jgi:hypothetical protein
MDRRKMLRLGNATWLAAVVGALVVGGSRLAEAAGAPATPRTPADGGALANRVDLGTAPSQIDAGATDAGDTDAGDTDAGETVGSVADGGAYWHESFAAAAAADAGPPAAPLAAAAEQLPTTPIVQQETPSGDQVAVARPGNAPLDRSLRGFIPIPGTKAIFKVGGFVRLMMVSTSKAVPEQDKWVTSSIPVQGQPGYNTGEEFNVDANQSRLNLDFRSPSPLGSVRVYYENDFSNTDNQSFVYNLRYMYTQVANLLVGWSDSLMVDADARAETLDLQGPNGAVKKKHALMRYFLLVTRQKEELTWVGFSLEEPNSDLPASISGARSVLPDAVLASRLEGPRGHVQASGIVRDIGFQNQTTGVGQQVFGWGLSLTADLVILKGPDHASAQVTYGHGVGNYIADTSGNGYDAALNSNGQLKPLPLFSGYLAYTHHWTDQFWSCASWGFLNLWDLDFETSLGPTALHGSQYVSANLVWNPTRRLFVGLEGLYGHNQAINNAGGNAYRGMLMLQVHFF